MNKKSRQFRLLTVLLAAVMCVALSLGVYAASSNAATKDNLTVQLFTDKGAYEANEAIKVAVQIENKTGKEVYIHTTLTLPAGVTLANGNLECEDTLEAGETWITPGGELLPGAGEDSSETEGDTTGTGEDSTENDANAPDAGEGTPDTGDRPQVGFWAVLFVLAGCGIVAVAIYGKNKKSWMSMLLCLIMVGSLGAAAVPAQAADTTGSIEVSCTVKVDGKDTQLSAVVDYIIYGDEEVSTETEAPETEAPETEAPGAGGGEEPETTEKFSRFGYEIVAVTGATGLDENGEFINVWVPKNSYDGSLDTMWSIDGKGSYVIYDLGEVKSVGYMGLMVNYSNTRAAYFDLEVSEDGENWTPVLTGKTTPLSENEKEMVAIDFDAIDARYIKFVGQGNAKNNINSIIEICFFPDTESGEMPVPDFTLSEYEIVAITEATGLDENGEFINVWVPKKQLR